jgi:two-component system chemotaxis response regulator CheY
MLILLLIYSFYYSLFTKKGGKHMARILIVDDAAFMRNSLKFIIESAGHEAAGLAANGAEAVKLYSELKPDLVTLDILMKETNGLEALKKIMDNDPQAKVLMITALGQESMQEEAKALGALGYIRKPFKTDDVVSELERALKNKDEG